MITDEQKEIVVNSYAKTFDKELAYKKVGLTEEEIALLENDPGFQDRLSYFLIEQRELIIEKYQNFMLSQNDNIAFKATQDFAKLIYPDFFNNLKDKDKEKEPDKGVNLTINMPMSQEDEERLEKEFGEVLGKHTKFNKTS